MADGTLPTSASAVFARVAPLRFADCDPAGIGFYPRLFEMLNAAVEDWAAERLGCPFAHMHGRLRRGLPTVRTEADFRLPLQLGETVSVELRPTGVGRSSVRLDFRFTVEGEVRVEGRSVLVWFDLDSRRATAWPEDLSRRLRDMARAAPSLPERDPT